MKAADENEAELLCIGATAIGLRKRGLPWHMIARSLGFETYELKVLAVAYALTAAQQGEPADAPASQSCQAN